MRSYTFTGWTVNEVLVKAGGGENQEKWVGFGVKSQGFF